MIRANGNCSNCRKTSEEFKTMRTCSNCHRANYCDKNCQKKHWQEHKRYCKIYKKGTSMLYAMKADNTTPTLYIRHERKFVSNYFISLNRLILSKLNVFAENIDYLNKCVLIESTEYMDRSFRIKKVDVIMKTEAKEMFFQNDQLPDYFWSSSFGMNPPEKCAIGIITITGQLYYRIFPAGFDTLNGKDGSTLKYIKLL